MTEIQCNKVNHFCQYGMTITWIGEMGMGNGKFLWDADCETNLGWVEILVRDGGGENLWGSGADYDNVM